MRNSERKPRFSHLSHSSLTCIHAQPITTFLKSSTSIYLAYHTRMPQHCRQNLNMDIRRDRFQVGHWYFPPKGVTNRLTDTSFTFATKDVRSNINLTPKWCNLASTQTKKPVDQCKVDVNLTRLSLANTHADNLTHPAVIPTVCPNFLPTSARCFFSHP